MRLLCILFVGLIAAIAAPQAEAQQNLLIGTWFSVEHNPPGQAQATTTETFWPNGNYEVRIAVSGGQGTPGVVIYRGRYEFGGPNEIRYWELSFTVCSGGTCTLYASCSANSCGPWPPSTDFGRPKISTFEFNGANRMMAGGLIWWRQR